VYVNLIAERLACLAVNLSDINDLHLRASGKCTHNLLDLSSILCIVNKFRANKHGGHGLVLMPIRAPPFAIFKPTLWRQKDENQNDNAQHIPLPGVSGVIPKKQFFQQINQIER